MAVKNSYPEKPVVARVLKAVSGIDVANYIKSTNHPDSVKQVNLAIKAAESGWNGNAINNNLFGIQADGGK